ncbi:MAG: MBL fold metallo-hydrolase [Clostridia bacterium]|nr:MBL fold metallo-hydrolase [Clostridia bacterium]
MKFCNIASGSKGNATFVYTDNTLVLIDVGISYKALVKQCKDVGIDLSRLDAICITHEHSDHIKGLKTLSNELDVPIYMNPKSYNALKQKVGDILHVQEEEFVHPIQIKDLEISAFRHTHDAAYTQGFDLSDGNKRLVMATDLGKVTPAIYKRMQGADYLYIESNYDLQSLINGPYPQYLKSRICGQLGHLCNSESSLTIKNLVQEGSRRFMLAHLSETNNTPELAKSTLLSTLKEIKVKEMDIDLKIADQYTPSEVIEI